MNEQELLKNKVDVLEQELSILKDYIMHVSTQDTFAMRRKMRIEGDTNLNRLTLIGDSTLGTATSKLGFFGATPVIQQPAITKPAGGATIDTEGRTATNKIIDYLKLFGFTL